MSQLIQREESSHWYLRDGTPFHTVPLKKDPTKTRATTLRDARDKAALPSVTNILGVMAAPQLEAWKREQAVLAALTLPRIKGETDDQFARRVVDDADSISKTAMDLGTRVHAAAEAHLRGQPAPVDFEAVALLQPAIPLLNQFDISTVEQVVVSKSGGYAGRLDMAGIHESGRHAVVDIKTQNVKKNAAGNPAPSFYDKWPLQLAAYAEALGWDSKECMLVSLVIDTNPTGCAEMIDWNADKAFPLAYGNVFANVASVWRYVKNYDPRGEVVHEAA